MAALFGELMLLPEEVLNDAPTRARLEAALESACDKLLYYPPGATLPEIRCVKDALQLRMNCCRYIRFAQVPERVSTMSSSF